MKTILLLMMFISLSANANETQERIYLAQIRNQLNAIKPLIISAAKAQPKTNRIQFHYTSYFDMSEKRHNGLLEDINAIEDGINVKLKQMPREPNIFLPIKGDYLDHDHLSKSK